MTDSLSPPESRRAVIVRRLSGLAVLLLATFFASLLIRSHDGKPADEGLPTVVIPLQSSPTPSTVAAARDQTPADAVTEPDAKPTSAASVPKPAEPILREVPAAKSVATPVAPQPKPAPKASAEKKGPKPVTPPAVTTSKPAPKPQPAGRRWQVVVGAFRDPAVAQAVAQRVRSAGFKAAVTATAPVKGERLQRVSAGPFDDEDAAQSARATLIVEGLTKAVVQSAN